MPKTAKNKSEKSLKNEDFSELYESILDRVLAKARKGGAYITDLVDEVGDDFHALEELGKDKAALLKSYVKRDLLDAGNYLNTSGNTLRDWLGFDMALIESKLWLNFSEAADQTTLELIKLREQATLQTYHTGESIGIGTLQCDECDALLHFHRPSKIPPCAKCHHTSFHRASASSQ